MDNTTEKREAFNSFVLNPQNVHFESQQADEAVILILRAHPATQIPWLINSFFMTILIVVLNFILPLVLTPSQILFVNIFGVAGLFAYMWYNFLLWFFNVGIITNERIVDIDFKSILFKEVTATKVEKVEEVTSKSGGYVGSLFNYGTVYVETASNEINIEFERVPHPAQVVEIINNLVP
ncbi:MAG: PH domain-containing protein [Patescibacteria group bacterium]